MNATRRQAKTIFWYIHISDELILFVSFFLMIQASTAYVSSWED